MERYLEVVDVRVAILIKRVETRRCIGTRRMALTDGAVDVNFHGSLPPSLGELSNTRDVVGQVACTHMHDRIDMPRCPVFDT